MLKRMLFPRGIGYKTEVFALQTLDKYGGGVYNRYTRRGYITPQEGTDMADCCNRETRTTVRTEEEKKAIRTRLNRIAGQIGGIGRMVEEDRYCDDILIQLSAVDKAVKSLASYILDAHVHGCLIRDIREGKTEVVDELVDLFKRFQ